MLRQGIPTQRNFGLSDLFTHIPAHQQDTSGRMMPRVIATSTESQLGCDVINMCNPPRPESPHLISPHSLNTQQWSGSDWTLRDTVAEAGLI